MTRPTPLIPTALATGTGLAFAALARVVHRRPDNPVDEKARDEVLESTNGTVQEAHKYLKRPGKWYVLVPSAVAASALLARVRGWVAGVPVALASVLAAAVAEGSEAWLPSRPPPPRRNDPEEPSFPSGHTLQPTALSLTAAYVLSREGLVRPQVAAPVALAVPLVFGFIQLPGDRHWFTDVAGGWLAGLSVAAACVAVYEALAER
ncbi:phosphatase PAP2 family protein [Pyxidicoccus fallax]|uniref:Phosphatase PAP2 family protein n=1 Tax=Pyxidicoccus fallax TaxID=394095 RepID=A0A848LEH3_9BACT|nr:phosphatase PAP2 family protein [Pyxidicoccus fallax]NMO13868.1 phosphatase PAP2 family protein [Pyxidicoccus fallax]NPC77660.1 phosphatase PAP2 family protein [Pyxidicoccus fallax]